MKKDPTEIGALSAMASHLHSVDSWLNPSRHARPECEPLVDTRKIVVLGRPTIEKRHLVKIARDEGYDSKQFEFNLVYKPRNVGLYRNPSRYLAILVGPIAHKLQGIGNYSSALAWMEQDEGFPVVFRVGDANALKLSTTSFRRALLELRTRLHNPAIPEGLVS